MSMLIPLISLVAGEIGISCVVEEIQSSYVFPLGISASDRGDGINMFRKGRGKMNNGILQGL